MPGNLREAGPGTSAGRARIRVRAAIAALQIAIALVVTIGAALLLRTAHRLAEVHAGFRAEAVTTIRTQLPMARYDDAAAVAFYTQLVARVRALPSVGAAGVTTKLPLGSGATAERAFRAAHTGGARALPVVVVDGGYFDTMAIPVLAGRGFRASERATAVVISRRAAATMFGDVDGHASLGRQLVPASPAGRAWTVVGVIGDVRDHDLASAPPPLVYRPLAAPEESAVEPAAPRNMALVVRTSAPAAAIVPALRQVVHELDPTIPVYGAATMEDVVGASTARLSLVLALMAAAAVVTLMLGAIGLYGVLAYTVALRTREFGVRAALGAEPRRIARLVAAHGLTLALTGIAAGFAIYAPAAPLLRAFLFGVTPTDSATLAAATLVLLATSLAASWLPANRAARVDPARALRAA